MHCRSEIIWSIGHSASKHLFFALKRTCPGALRKCATMFRCRRVRVDVIVCDTWDAIPATPAQACFYIRIESRYNLTISPFFFFSILLLHYNSTLWPATTLEHLSWETRLQSSLIYSTRCASTNTITMPLVVPGIMTNPEDKNQEWANKLVGKTFSESESNETMFCKKDLPETHRIIKPGQPVTRDFRPERLNVHLKEDGTVSHVVHG